MGKEMRKQETTEKELKEMKEKLLAASIESDRIQELESKMKVAEGESEKLKTISAELEREREEALKLKEQLEGKEEELSKIDAEFADFKVKLEETELKKQQRDVELEASRQQSNAHGAH